MSYGMKRLADVELLNTTPENAHKLVEVDGDIKRVPNKDNGLPEGGAPNQQLVTDADGVAKWDDTVDAIIEVSGNCNVNTVFPAHTNKSFTLVKGDCNTLFEKLTSGIVPRVFLRGYVYYGEDVSPTYTWMRPATAFEWFVDSENGRMVHIEFAVVEDTRYGVTIEADNQIHPCHDNFISAEAPV